MQKPTDQNQKQAPGTTMPNPGQGEKRAPGADTPKPGEGEGQTPRPVETGDPDALPQPPEAANSLNQPEKPIESDDLVTQAPDSGDKISGNR